MEYILGNTKSELNEYWTDSSDCNRYIFISGRCEKRFCLVSTHVCFSVFGFVGHHRSGVDKR